MRICLYQPDIAGNVGNIIRTAECLGVNFVDIILPTGFIFDDKQFKRASLDYGDSVEIIKYKTFTEYCDKFNDRKILLTTKTTDNYYDFKFKEDDILVFGSESRGVSDEVRFLVDEKLTIPIRNNCRSLNLAISVAIITSEAVRQLQTVL